MSGPQSHTPPGQVRPEEFSRQEDLPVGQVLRRFGARRLGDDQAPSLTEVQERLARTLELRARGGIAARPLALIDRSPQQGRRPMHLEVGSRYLPLRVDTGFGRFGDMQIQSLFPTGGGRYHLDVAMLRLWVEQEMEALESQWTSLRADTLESFQQAARQTLAAPGEAANQLPPAVAAQPQVAAQRQKLRQAMLQAVQGDTSALSTLLHGEQAQKIAARLQARAQQEAARQQAAQLAQAQPQEGGQALAAASIIDSPAAALPLMALEGEVLEALRQELPALSVDASGASFSFEAAAAQVMQTARRAAARAARVEQPLAQQAAPGTRGAQALRFARRRDLSRARMFGPSAVEAQATEAIARGMTPFVDSAATPQLPALRQAPEPGQPAMLAALPSQRFVARDAQTPELAATRPRRPLGQLSMKAMTPRGAQALEGRPARAWMMAGGAGVLLAGLDDSGPPAAQPEQDPVAWWPAPLPEQPSQEQIAQQAAQQARALLAAVEALAPSYASALAPTLLQPEALVEAPVQAARRALLQRQAPQALEQAHLAPVTAQALEALPQAARRALEAATQGPSAQQAAVWAGAQGYSATQRGDFAQIIAQATTTSLLAQQPALGQTLRGHAWTQESGDPSAQAPQGQAAPLARALAGQVQQAQQALDLGVGAALRRQASLEDMEISGQYMPSLVRSLEQLGHSAQRLQRFSAPLARRTQARQEENAGLTRVRAAVRALRHSALASPDALPLRVAELAQSFAEALRDTHAPSQATVQREGYNRGSWWGNDLVPVQMEAPVAPARPAGDEGAVRWYQHQLSQAMAQSQAHVEKLSQLVQAQPRVTQAEPGPAAISTSGRALSLFSPEKTMALLAPQLESGALLDASSRRELSAALEELSQQSAASPTASSAPRRVPTPFGTLTVQMKQGQLTVHTDETTSLAPSVSLSRQAQGQPQQASPVVSAASTGREQVLAQVARRLGEVASTSTLEKLATAGASGFEVLLGAASRAERQAQVYLDQPLGAAQVAQGDLETIAQRLGIPAASAAQALAEQLAPKSPQRRSVGIQHGSAGEVVQVSAQGQRATEVIEALQRSGFALPAGAYQTLERAFAQPAQAQRADARPAPAAQAALGGASLLSALRNLEGEQLSSLARFLDEAPGSATQPLERLLEEAREARTIGALGRVGMQRPAMAGLTQADMAYALPFLQRQAEAERAAGQPGAATRPLEALGQSPQAPAQTGGPSSASSGALSPLASSSAQSLLSHSLLLGSAGNLDQLALRMGLPAGSLREDGAGLALQAQAAALGAAQRSPASLPELQRPTYRAVDGQVAPDAELFRPSQEAEARLEETTQTLRRERARLMRVSQRLQAPQAPPSPEQHRASLRPVALSGSMLQQLGAVGQVLESLGITRGQSLGAQVRQSSALQAARHRLSQASAGELISASLPSVGLDADLEPGEQRSPSPATGRVGVWVPAGVERLVSESSDSLLSGRGDFSATHVAPSLFQLRDASGRRVDGVRSASLRAVGQGMALGLRQLGAGAAGAPGYVPMGMGGGAGDLLAVGAGASPLSRSQLMQETRNHGRIQSFMEMVSAAAAGAAPAGVAPGAVDAPVGAQVSVGRPAPPSPQGLSVGRAPTTMLAPGQWGGVRREGYQSAPEPPRTLFKPFTPPAPSAGSASQPDGKPWAEGFGNQQGVAPRASMGDNRHEESRAERTERHTHEGQAQAPNQEQIEDIAREVLDVLKHRWMIELERRGIE